MRRPELHFFSKSAIIPRQDPFFFGIRHDGAQHTRGAHSSPKIRIEGLDQHSTTGRRRVAIRIGRQQARKHARQIPSKVPASRVSIGTPRTVCDWSSSVSNVTA